MFLPVNETVYFLFASARPLHLTSRSFVPDSFHSELILLAAQQIQRLSSELDAVNNSELSTCIRPLISDGELDMEFINLTPFLVQLLLDVLYHSTVGCGRPPDV
ncbi:hypothetical protein MAR_021794 [Mya arenaria]|uniref:Uncharacterized protein n=1 Tax=Mya arenaria TaxID=6604 RepID=A0ABY7E8S1_MYAAR|nr:hypothetical protein MAR_021794 [Mya arenaria]